LDHYETEAAKQEAIDTLRLLMTHATSDEAYRGYSQHLDRVLSRPVIATLSWADPPVAASQEEQ